jgi:hypothetical protein
VYEHVRVVPWLVVQNLSTLALGYLVALAFDWRMALLITGEEGNRPQSPFACRQPAQFPLPASNWQGNLPGKHAHPSPVHAMTRPAQACSPSSRFLARSHADT